MPDQCQIQIPRPSVKEGSAFTATAYFRLRSTGAADAPSTVKYRIDNLTVRQTVLDWTTATASAAVSIAITATNTAIRDQINREEKLQLTVAGNPDTSTQVRESIVFEVENIRGF